MGRPRDPRLSVDPNRFRPGRRYKVEVQITDATFTAATQIRFGTGIEVKGFTVHTPLAALAEIAVDADAAPGAREVLTFQPDAGTLTGIVIEEPTGVPPLFTGFVRALCFDAGGHLVSVLLDQDREIPVAGHGGRLQLLLAQARDDNREVAILLDERGRLNRVTVGA